MLRVIPQLVVQSIAASRKFYETHLGMTTSLLDPPTSPVFALLEGGDASLFLVTAGEEPSPGKSPGAGVRLYFEVDDAKAKHRSMKKAGVEIVRDLRYNEREDYTEFVVRDPCGYEIGIYS